MILVVLDVEPFQGSTWEGSHVIPGFALRPWADMLNPFGVDIH